MNRIVSLSSILALILPALALRVAADEPGASRDDPQPPQTYRSELQASELATPESVLLERHRLDAGAAGQGIALSKRFYFTSTSGSICKYDRDWNLLQEQSIRIPGVNHLGAIHLQDGFLWVGLLHGPENGKHDPKQNRSVIAKIRASDLAVVATWDITSELDWIDPVCFDGQRIWVGDLHDLGIHCYRFEADQLKHVGAFRYPKALSFSQGIRVVGRKLYSIHTFGSMDGLFLSALHLSVLNFLSQSHVQRQARRHHPAQPPKTVTRRLPLNSRNNQRRLVFALSGTLVTPRSVRGLANAQIPTQPMRA